MTLGLIHFNKTYTVERTRFHTEVPDSARTSSHQHTSNMTVSNEFSETKQGSLTSNKCFSFVVYFIQSNLF